MARGNEQHPTSIRVTPLPRAGAELKVHPAFERYVQAVRSKVDRELTADEVEVRLAQTLATHARTAPPESGPQTEDSAFASRAGWAAYGFQAVQLWLRAIAMTGRSGAWLRSDDIDDLAVETAARALHTCRDQSQWPQEITRPRAAGAELKTVFLTECLRHLPYAYQACRLVDLSDPGDELEPVNEPQLVRLVQECAAVEQGALLRRVGGLEEADMDEMVGLTLLAVRTAARRYPDAFGQDADGTGHAPLP